MSDLTIGDAAHAIDEADSEGAKLRQTSDAWSAAPVWCSKVI